jgi:Mg-chelatase subunit ChlD
MMSVILLLSVSGGLWMIDPTVGLASSRHGSEGTEDIAFFSFTYGPDINYSRCPQSVNGVNSNSGSIVVGNEPGRANLGLLRSTPDLGVIVAGFGKIFGDIEFNDPGAIWDAANRKADSDPYGSLYVLRREGESIDQWEIATTVVGPQFHHGIEILPDGDTLLVSTTEMSQDLVRVPPFQIEKYRLREVSRIQESKDRPGTHRLGAPINALELPNPVVNILLDPTRESAHALTKEHFDWREPLAETDMALHTFDAIQMTEIEPPIEVAKWKGWANDLLIPMMTESPDGVFLVTTRGPVSSINVVDLVQRQAWTVDINDAGAITDAAFNSGPENHGLLAINVRSRVPASDRPEGKPWVSTKTQVRVGTLVGAEFRERGRGPWIHGNTAGAPAAVAWTKSGAAIIAAVDHRASALSGAAPDPMAAVFAVSNEGRIVEKSRDLYPCRESSFVMDILTENGHLPTVTTTPTASLTATTTPTLTPTRVPTKTETPTPTSIAKPGPVYLPILLRERCTPLQKRQDVVLIIDTSSSMKESSRAGRRKIEAAQEAALRYIDLLLLDDGDRAAVVSFDVEARTHIPLSADREALVAAITKLRVGEKTCLPCAVQQGAEELAGPMRREGFTPVIILLTDGRSNPRPISEAIEEATTAKRAGIIVFTVGLGNEIERGALQQIASKPHFFYHAPEAEDLSAIYESIAVEVPCSVGRFWGRR